MTDHEFRVRWYQQDFHKALVNREYDRLIAIWHRRAGKDEIVLNAMRTLAMQDPGTYWHCFPEQKQARKAIWNGVNGHTGKRRIFDAFPPSIIKRMQDDDMFIELTNGSTFQLIGSDRYDSTVGSGPKGIAYSEWALSNPSAWAYHSPMIRESKGFAAFITTPRGDNHAKTMFDRAINNDNWFSQILSINETEALTSEQLEEALQEYQDLHGNELGLSFYEQEYECSFAGAMVGAYWGGDVSRAERSGQFGDLPIDENYPVHTAWDLGRAGNNPIWCFQVVGSELRIVDFYSSEENDLSVWCDWLNDQGYHGVDWVPHDVKHTDWGVTHTRRDRLRDQGRNAKQVGTGKVAHVAEGIHAGREAIKVARFHTGNDARGKRVKEGVQGLKSYRREWDDDKKVFKDTPYKDWAEHISSAFRYLGLTWREEVVRTEKPKEKQESIYQAMPGGRIQSNMTVKEAVEAMVRKRKRRG